MKAIKYVFIGALMLSISTPVMAQQDNKSIIDNISIAIKENPAAAEAKVKEVVKQNKKNVEVLCGIGRAYLDIKDTEKARQYADMAMKVKGGAQNALPHILLGDIYVVNDDGGNASMEYEQAINFDKTNPEPYRKYAQINSKVSPASSAAKLEELRQVLPNYPVDVINATIYMRANNLTKALEYYDKVEKNSMESSDIVNYSLCGFLKGQFEKSREIAEFGASKFPRHPALNRLVFFNSTNLKDYSKALEYADRLFTKSDSAKISASDYLYYGHAYNGSKNYDKAIEMFRKCIEVDPNAKADVADAMKNISNAYEEKGDYNNAIIEYKNYLSELDKQSSTDLNGLASLYRNWGSTLTGAEQAAKFNLAQQAYDDMLAKFPGDADIASFVYFMKARLDGQLDPETKDFRALNNYQKLAEIIEPMAEKDAAAKNRLIEAYRYLGYYNLVKNNKAQSDSYWKKILEIDPTNQAAKDALGM
jgi:tetratricopeptide (TPR) repeat protein